VKSKGKRLKINIKKTKLMVSGTKRELPKSKIESCGICEE